VAPQIEPAPVSDSPLLALTLTAPLLDFSVPGLVTVDAIKLRSPPLDSSMVPDPIMLTDPVDPAESVDRVTAEPRKVCELLMVTLALEAAVVVKLMPLSAL
jgi:hypothetical protein